MALLGLRPLEQNCLGVAPSTMKVIEHGFEANLTTVRRYIWKGEVQIERLPLDMDPEMGKGARVASGVE